MVGTAEDMPGGGWFEAEAPVADGEDGDEARGADFRLPQAVINAPAAAVPTPSSASRRRASRRDSRPSTWSVAISSAM